MKLTPEQKIKYTQEQLDALEGFRDKYGHLIIHYIIQDGKIIGKEITTTKREREGLREYGY